MGDFLTSGRRTPFGPAKKAERETMRRGDPLPQRDPTVPRALAEAASKLLDDPAFRHVMDTMADDAHKAFASSGAGTIGQNNREEAYMQLRALDTIVSRLGAMMDDARIYADREAAENPPSDNGYWPNGVKGDKGD